MSNLRSILAAHDERRRHSARQWPGRGGGSLDFAPRAELFAPTTVIQLDRHRRRDEVTAGEDEASPSVIRILLIDDDDDDVLILRDLLARSERMSFVIEHAADLEQGLTGLLAAAHDIALIANRLACTDALAPARLATPQRGAGMPVILLADGASPELAAAAVAGGASDVLEMEELDAERLERAIRIALARRRRTARLEGLAARDALTGLPGPPLFRDRLELALARARRQNTLAAIVAFDLDRFELVNRRFDHAAGDSLLV